MIKLIFSLPLIVIILFTFAACETIGEDELQETDSPPEGQFGSYDDEGYYFQTAEQFAEFSFNAPYIRRGDRYYPLLPPEGFYQHTAFIYFHCDNNEFIQVAQLREGDELILNNRDEFVLRVELIGPYLNLGDYTIGAAIWRDAFVGVYPGFRGSVNQTFIGNASDALRGISARNGIAVDEFFTVNGNLLDESMLGVFYNSQFLKLSKNDIVNIGFMDGTTHSEVEIVADVQVLMPIEDYYEIEFYSFERNIAGYSETINFWNQLPSNGLYIFRFNANWYIFERA